MTWRCRGQRGENGRAAGSCGTVCPTAPAAGPQEASCSRGPGWARGTIRTFLPPTPARSRRCGHGSRSPAPQLSSPGSGSARLLPALLKALGWRGARLHMAER